MPFYGAFAYYPTGFTPESNLAVPWILCPHPDDPIGLWTVVGVRVGGMVLEAVVGDLLYRDADIVIFHFYHNFPHLLPSHVYGYLTAGHRPPRCVILYADPY
jgi:hypothetical protein